MSYYYFDITGNRLWSQVKIGAETVRPLSDRPYDLAWDDDIIFIHWTDFFFTKDDSSEFIDFARGRALSEPEAADQERIIALTRLSQAVASGLEGKTVIWYIYSGDKKGAEALVTATEKTEGSPIHDDIPKLTSCSWVKLTSRPLFTQAEQITRWLRDVLNICDPGAEEFEHMFRLFLDAEMIARFAEYPTSPPLTLPEWLAKIVRSAKIPRPDWQHFFRTARTMAAEGAPSTWPFSEFPDDIRQLAIANSAANRKSWFEPGDEGFSDYQEKWKARYLKSAP